MAEYIEREAALKFQNELEPLLCRNVVTHDIMSATKDADLVEYLRSIPAADVAPVVRCKECRHRDPEDHKCDSGEMERQGCPFPVHDDYFCAYGEKMDGGEENGKEDRSD